MRDDSTRLIGCPPEAELRALLAGDDSAAAHVQECERCQQMLESLAGELKPGATAADPELDRAMRRLVSDGADDEREDELDFLAPSDLPGYKGKIGPYSVIELVGQGGMGIVLKAHDPVLGRIVAVKVLNPAMAKDAPARRRFSREARAAAAVTHEHVVTIHAVDDAGGLPYLVMQFVSGKSLEKRIRQTGPLELEEVLRIGMQTASGLAAAHAQGLVHRDIKPANIMLENGVERVKITDFGLARAVDGDDAGVTMTGQISGTPAYMSPEQVRGERVDFRTDLWGLGCVMYAMCSGAAAFGGPTALSVIRKVCDVEPMPLAEANPSIPTWLIEIVGRLMQKDPAKRPGSAREVAAELEQRLADVQARRVIPAALPRAGGTGRRWLPVAAAIVVTAALASAAVKWWPRAQTGAGAATQSVASTQSAAPVITGDFLVVNDGDPRAFPTLADAVAGAPDGGVVEIRRSGAIRTPRVDVGKKALTIRAAEGNYPVLAEEPDAPVGILTTLAPLKLEGVAFAATRSEEKSQRAGIGDALVTAGGELRVLNCRFQLSAPRTSRAPCIRVGRGGNARVRNTELHAPRGVVIHWVCEEAGEVTLQNCVLSGGMAVAVQKSGDAETKLAFDGCSAGVGALVFLPPGDTPHGLSVDVRGCAIETGALLMDGGIESASARLSAVAWSDSQSLFDVSPSKGKVMMERATEGANRDRGTNSYNADIVFEVPLGVRLNKGEMPMAGDLTLKSVRGPGGQLLPPRRLAGYGAKIPQVGIVAFTSYRRSTAYQEWER